MHLLLPRRALGVAVALAGVAVAGGATVSPGAGVAAAVVVAPAPTCSPINMVLGQCPPTPTPTPTPTRSPNPGSTPRPSASATPVTVSPPPGSTFALPPPPPTFPTGTLTAPGVSTSPGPPPGAPSLPVQRIVLVATQSDGVPVGSSVTVQATAEATVGTDTYAVPGAALTFTVTNSPGSAATVTPTSATTGPTGAVSVTLQLGQIAGDTVLTVSAGSVSDSTIVHAVAAAQASGPTSTPGPAQLGVVQTGTTGGTSRGRVLLAVLLAIGGGVLALVLVLKAPLPAAWRRRRAAWGRRSV